MEADMPTIGAIQYSQCAVQFPDASAGPSERAGLKLPPVSGPVTRAPANTVAPIANGATVTGLRGSVATAMMTKPSTPVNPASTRRLCAMGSDGSVAPNAPTGPSIQPNRNAAA